MQTTEPTIEERRPQTYVAVASEVTMAQLPEVIPSSLDTVFSWLGANDLAPTGPPFIRYRVIDMAGSSKVEVGVPLAGPVDADGMVTDELPGGEYASLVYLGAANGVAANKVLIDWAVEQGVQWDRWDDVTGDAFACRFESFLDGPDDDPDPANWRTEVAIKLARP